MRAGVALAWGGHGSGVGRGRRRGWVGFGVGIRLSGAVNVDFALSRRCWRLLF